MKKFWKVCGEKVWEIPPTLFEKNSYLHIITVEGAFSASVPIGPWPVRLKKGSYFCTNLVIFLFKHC
ncbi:hypothetical protein COM65_28565 [Bacillus wiedmannii]|nr:hypothetical protein COM65_28565 [Bacillus wiedmannii]